MHVHMQYTQACICTYCDLLFTICIFYVYTYIYIYIYIYSLLCFYMRCSVEMFLNVSSFFFITKIIDIVKMTPLVFEHVSTLTKKNCVCVHVFSLSSYLCMSLCETPGGTYEMRTVSPPKFNMSPLKSYRNPIGKGLSSNDHFLGAMLNFGGVDKFLFHLNTHYKNIYPPETSKKMRYLGTGIK